MMGVEAVMLSGKDIGFGFDEPAEPIVGFSTMIICGAAWGAIVGACGVGPTIPVTAALGAAAGAGIAGVYYVIKGAIVEVTEHGERVERVRLSIDRIEAERSKEFAHSLINREQFDRLVAALEEHPVSSLNLNGLRRIRRFLWSTNFSREDLVNLATRMDVSQLERLSLSDCGLDEVSASAFFARFPSAPLLERVDVSKNSIGSSAWQLFGIMKYHTALKKVNLSDCGLSIADCCMPEDAAVSEALAEQPLKLLLSGNPFDGKITDLDKIADQHANVLRRVAECHFDKVGGLAETGFSLPRIMPALTHVSMSDCKMTSWQLSAVYDQWAANRLPLQELAIARTKIDDVLFNSMAHFIRATPTLTTLSFSASTICLKDESLYRVFANALVGHTHLKSVHASGAFKGDQLDKMDAALKATTDDIAFNKDQNVLSVGRDGAESKAGDPTPERVAIYADWHKSSDYGEPSACSVM